MTKEQALQILQEAIDRGIDPDEDVEIFDAIKIAIECLQSDHHAPDWSQAPKEANYHTTDADGQRFYHEFEPIKDGGYFLTADGMVWRDQREGSERIVKRPK